MKSGSLCLMSLAALLLTGCPVYGDAPTCNGPGCYDDDDDDWCDDDDDHGGSGGYGGYAGNAGSGGYAGKAGSGGYGGGSNPPRSPIGINEYLQILRLDAASVPRAEAADLLYVDFHAAYNNNRFGDAELGAFANATLKLLNQLDVRATAPNGQGAVIVLDDRNLPLAVRVNVASFNLDKQRDILDTVVRLSNRQDSNDPFFCEIPTIPGIDFLHIAASDDVFNPLGDNGQGTFESGYSNIALRRLLVDAGLLAEEQRVFDAITVQQFINNGFANVSANVGLYDALAAVDPVNFDRQALDTLYNVNQDDSRLVRGCLLNSNVSAANRCIDRLTQSAPAAGATYLTFDVFPFGNGGANHDFFEAAFRGPNNPPSDPLVRPGGGPDPFVVDGGEAIYQLKNSMLGFLTFNGNFQLLSNGLNPEFGNPTTGSGITNATCSYCHSSFTIPFTDAMLPTLIGAPGNPDFEFAFKVAQSQDSWDTTVTIDAAYYQEALRNVYFVQSEYGELPDGIWSLGKQYMNDLSTEDVVAELGVHSAEELIDALYNSTEPDAFDLANQLASNGGISRENFTRNYQLLVELIATGNEDFLRGCVVREASDPGDFPDEDPGDGFRRHLARLRAAARPRFAPGRALRPAPESLFRGRVSFFTPLRANQLRKRVATPMKKRALYLTAVAAFALGGCLVSPESAPPTCRGERCGDPGGYDDDDDDDDLPPPAPQDRGVSPEEVAGVANLFRTKCLDCHGNGQAFGGLADVLDVADMKRRNLIGATADTSALFQVVASRHAEGRVSPRTARPVVLPTEREIAFVRTWLDAGALELRGERQPLDLATYADVLRADAARLRVDASRLRADGDLVYVDFHAAYNNNGRFNNTTLMGLVDATFKLLNQLDVRSTTTSKPSLTVVADDQNLPLAVRFRPSEFGLDKQRDILDTVARLANRQDSNDPFFCEIPAIPVLDFLHIAASDDVFNPLGDNGQGAFESGYSNIALRRLLVDAGRLADGQLVFEPITQAAFAANGFANVSANVGLYDALAAVDPGNFDRPSLDALYNVSQDSTRLARGCLLNSNASAAQRCVDRLTQSAPAAGATYLSFDASVLNNGGANRDFFEAAFFGPAGPAADPLVRPVDGFQPFVVDGGQGIVRLKNAMLGFFSFNADFRLVSNAPTYAAVAGAAADQPPFSSTAACGSCHNTFAVPFRDEMGPALSRGSSEIADVYVPPFVLNAAQSQEAWNAAFAADAEDYAGALRRVYYTTPEGPSFHDGVFVFGSQYRNDLSIEDVLAETGARSVDELLPTVDYVVEPDGSPYAMMPRDAFTQAYQSIIEGLNGGNDDFLRGCVVRSIDVF
jgi:hypothetical protein